MCITEKKILIILWVIEGLEDKGGKVSYKAITLNTSRYLLCEQLIINYTKKKDIITMITVLCCC
jgi:hypothetical protein